MNNREIHLFYHDKCMDGLLAANFIFEKLGTVTLQPFTYPEKPDVLKYTDCDVVVVDYVIPADIISTLLVQGCRVIIIDHHIAARTHFNEVMRLVSTRSTLLNNLFIFFNTQISAAGLSYLFADDVVDILNGGMRDANYFSDSNHYLMNVKLSKTIELIADFCEASNQQTPPKLIHYLSNSDSYSFQESLTESRWIRLAMEMHERESPEVDFTTFMHLYRRFKDNWVVLSEEGREIEEAMFPEIDSLIAAGTEIPIGNLKNSPNEGKFIVLYGDHDKVNTIAQRAFSRSHDTYFVVIARIDPDQPGLLKMSLRGYNPINPFNLSQLASVLNGNGHFNSSGARMEWSDEQYRDSQNWYNRFSEAGIDFTNPTELAL